MTDIVERQCDLCDTQPEFAFSDGTQLCRKCVQEAVNHRGLLHTIKHLRQRVRELEDRAASFEGSFNACEKELAALKDLIGNQTMDELAAIKAGQGEPVAYYDSSDPLKRVMFPRSWDD